MTVRIFSASAKQPVVSRRVAWSPVELIRILVWRELGFADGPFRRAEFGYGGFGEVAAVEDLPFVVEFGQDRGGEPVEGGRVGEDLDNVGRRLISRFSRSSGLVGQIFFPWTGGKSANAVMSVAAFSSLLAGQRPLMEPVPVGQGLEDALIVHRQRRSGQYLTPHGHLRLRRRPGRRASVRGPGAASTSAMLPPFGAGTVPTRLRAIAHSCHSCSVAASSAWMRSASSRSP